MRQRDRQADVHTRDWRAGNTRGCKTVFVLTEHSQYDVGADGGQKANNHQENSLTPQTLNTPLQSLGA